MALALGATVRELKARMTHREFMRWQLFKALRPFGPMWDDYRAAHAAAAVRQPWVTKPQDPLLLMALPRKKRKQTPEEMMQVVREAAANARAANRV